MFAVIGLNKSFAPTVWGRALFDFAFQAIPEVCEYLRIFLMNLITNFSPRTEEIVQWKPFQFWEYVNKIRAGSSESSESSQDLINFADFVTVPLPCVSWSLARSYRQGCGDRTQLALSHLQHICDCACKSLLADRANLYRIASLRTLESENTISTFVGLITSISPISRDCTLWMILRSVRHSFPYGMNTTRFPPLAFMAMGCGCRLE